MTSLHASFTHLPDSGRVGLVDLVHARNAEAALACASITERAAREVSGRLEWAGHVDQLLIGDIESMPNEVLVSSFPSKKQALDMIAARREWGLDPLVDRVDTYGHRVPTRVERTFVGALVRGLGLLGRKTPAADLHSPDLLETDLLDTGDPSLRPTHEALRTLAESDIEGKVVMLNLLRFRRDAQGDSATGRAAYARYGRPVIRMVAGLGGRLRARGHALRRNDDVAKAAWDEFVCVEYPSRADFIGMFTSSAYAAIHEDRDAGLDRTVLLACTSHGAFF